MISEKILFRHDICLYSGTHVIAHPRISICPFIQNRVEHTKSCNSATCNVYIIDDPESSECQYNIFSYDQDDDIPYIMSIVTTFETQCRALTSAPSPDENASRFLVGTQSPSAENFVYLFEYKDDTNNLAKVSLKFPYGESWHLSTSIKHHNLFTNVVVKDGQTRVTLYKLPQELENSIDDDYGLYESPIEEAFNLASSSDNSIVRQCHWHPDDGHQLLTCSDGNFEFWDINKQERLKEFSLFSALETSGRLDTSSSKKSRVTDLRWSSLFNCSVIAAACGPRIYGIDTRVPDNSCSSICWLIQDNRCNRVRSIDFNPNSQYYLASGGDDCRANFWDLRQTASPVLTLEAHTHWIWSIRYNPFHDQLILSAGSDARVALMRAQSIASEPFGQIVDEDEEDGKNDIEGADDKKEAGGLTALEPQVPTDEIINKYEEHDDSVYAAEWATDPWIFASLGYESRLVINKVPKSEKFKILF